MTPTELEYEQMAQYCEAAQQRLRETNQANRILRYKYLASKSEIADLLWTHLVSPRRLLGLPALDEAVVETADSLGPYLLGDTLGYGSSAVVRECLQPGVVDERYAVKIVDKARVVRYKALRRLCNEVVNTRAVDHPNVARLVEVVQTHTRLYLVLEHGGVRGVCAEIKSLSTPWRN